MFKINENMLFNFKQIAFTFTSRSNIFVSQILIILRCLRNEISIEINFL